MYEDDFFVVEIDALHLGVNNVWFLTYGIELAGVLAEYPSNALVLSSQYGD